MPTTQPASAETAGRARFTDQLGPTALAPGVAYVTELEPTRDHARILALSGH